MAEMTQIMLLAALTALDPHDDDADVSYLEQLRRLQAALVTLLDAVPASPDVATEATVRQAVGVIDPRNDDASQGYALMLRRLQRLVDIELSRWSSAAQQPVGPSGDTAAPVIPPVYAVPPEEP
jgi:hypothetical protein